MSFRCIILTASVVCCLGFVGALLADDISVANDSALMAGSDLGLVGARNGVPLPRPDISLPAPSQIPATTDSASGQSERIEVSADQGINESREIKRPSPRENVQAAFGNPSSRQNRSRRISPWPYVELLPLLAVLGLIVAAALLVKRFLPARGGGGSSGVMEIIARTTVSPKQSLMLVKLGRRVVLIGMSPDRMNTLTTVEDPDQVASLIGQIESQRPESMTQAFAHSFAEQTRAYDEQRISEESQLQAHGQVRGLLEKVRRLTKRREVA